MPADLHQARAMFLYAVGQLPPEQWDAYAVEASGGDAELAQQVQRFFQVHREAGSFLESPVVLLEATAGKLPGENAGTRIGPYTLREQLGEGGMGLVFVADQDQPVRRQVAVKVIKPGMDTRQVVARFEAERQALALMDHPNIARVLDGGATPSGRPFFVMELVRGVPITAYCDTHRLPPRQRLELFVQVCQAVQHAHTKGVIHRDVKPSNVLVAGDDGPPVVKVIDFGIAKAIGQRLTDQTIYTQVAQMVGTPLYMSPEQAGLDGLDVDTRTDIYSLGVLLYELLTGTTPFDRQRLQTAGLDEIRRIIVQEEPAKPSTRISTLEPAAADTVSANRRSDPRRLHLLCRGELDWVVMKALDKDRSRRYETANAFAQDVHRYLAHEPVLACPPSTCYRLRKFVRRNTGPVVAAAVVLVTLVAGVIGTTLGLVHAEQRAEGERRAREEAQKRLEQIEKGTETLAAVFTHLNPSAEEKEGKPLRAVLGERLVQAADQLEGDAVGDPLLVARLQVKLGQAMMGLDQAERAIPVLTKARATLTGHLGPDAPETLDVMRRLAWAYQRADQQDLALPLFAETFARTEANLGPDDPQTLTSMHALGSIYVNTGQFALGVPLLAEALRRQASTIGPGHPDTLASMVNLADGHRGAGNLARAVPLYEKALELARANLSPGHPTTLLALSNLARAHQDAGRPDRAVPLLEEMRRLAQAHYGPGHRYTRWGTTGLAHAYRDAGQWDRALPHLEEVVRLVTTEFGPDHPNTLGALANLAGAYQSASRRDDAERCRKELETRTKQWVAEVYRESRRSTMHRTSTRFLTAVLLSALAGCGGNSPASAEDDRLQNLPSGWRVASNYVAPEKQLLAFGQKFGADLVRLANTKLTVEGQPIQINVIDAKTDADADKVQQALLRVHKGIETLCPRDGRSVIEFVTGDLRLVERAYAELGFKRPKAVYDVSFRAAPLRDCDPLAWNKLYNAFLQRDETAIRTLAGRFTFGSELRLRNQGLGNETSSYTFDPKPRTSKPEAEGELTTFAFADLPAEFGVPQVGVTGRITAEAYSLTPSRRRAGPELLAANAFWPSNDPEVVALARKITDGKSSPHDKTEAILAWLKPGKNLRYGGKDMGSRYGVKQVLEQGQGRCWDFSDCFVTLCRAAGVPSRQVLGWLHGADGHVWAEVLIEGQGWRQVDPTAGTGCDSRYVPFVASENGVMPMVYTAPVEVKRRR